MKSIPHVALLLILGSTASQAAIVASGLRDLVITSDFAGIYLDIDGGGLVAEEATGWDLNAFFGGEGIANSPNFHPVAATVTLDSPILNLTPGTLVNGSNIFSSTYPGGYSSSDSHVGNSAGQFNSGSEGYIGFMFTTNDSSGPLYGWMRVGLSNTGNNGLIREWAYEDSGAGIAVGAVPEPSVICSLIAGVVMFCPRRRR